MFEMNSHYQRLKEGNLRFLSNKSIHSPYGIHSIDPRLHNSQSPFAAILSCSDSRVPVEIIFDQNFGDIFVIRVAGNIVNNNIIGSLEFSLKVCNSKIILVMGHTQCGAVRESINCLIEDNKKNEIPVNIKSIIDEVNCGIASTINNKYNKIDFEELFVESVKANVNHSISKILNYSSIIKDLSDNNEIIIIGGIYDIKYGKVDFFEPNIDV